MEGYDIAQVCTNGHTITSALTRNPQFSKKFCSKCGAKTISNCPDCNQPIQGSYFGAGLSSRYVPPSFCFNCSKPFPWVDAKIKAANALIDELDSLTPTEQEQLKNSLDDLVKDTPQTQVSTLRFKKLVAKSGQFAAGALRDILVDIVSETVKKAIWGSSK